jgi:hypothetical protein
VIDGVHLVRGLPAISVVRSQSKKSHGYYNRGGQIGLSQIADHPELTLAHEIGHFIDHRGFFGQGMSSEASDALSAWRTAVMKTPEIKNLFDIAAGKRNHIYAKHGVSFDANHVEYLLRTREIWARSYAQWIAQKSSDTVLMRQLNIMLKNQQKSVVKYTYQWQPENFKDVASAIDDVFSQIGWLK